MADSKKVFRVEYKAYMADSDKLIDTTYEDVAKDAGIFNDKTVYGPIAYISGSEFFFKPVAEAIEKAKIGEEFTVDVPCEKAAGVRDPKLIETRRLAEFAKADSYPQPGMTYALGNRNATVLKVGAGRVVVDFNNPLAGHDLKYVLKVTEEVTEPAAKAAAVIEANFTRPDDFKFDFPKDKVVVTVSDAVKFSSDWSVARFRVVSDLRAVFGVDTVEFVEVWSVAKPAEKKKEETSEQKSA